MIRFKELSKKYTPDNISTNFSNSTCRRRLLDKYIGAGKWEYVYDGRKAVGINLIDQEEEVIEPVVEEEVVQEQEEKTLPEIEKEINELKSRIKELEDLKASIKNKINPVDKMKELTRNYSKLRKSELEQRIKDIKKLYKENKNNKEIFKYYDKFMTAQFRNELKGFGGFYKSYTNDINEKYFKDILSTRVEDIYIYENKNMEELFSKAFKLEIDFSFFSKGYNGYIKRLKEDVLEKKLSNLEYKNRTVKEFERIYNLALESDCTIVKSLQIFKNDLEAVKLKIKILKTDIEKYWEKFKLKADKYYEEEVARRTRSYSDQNYSDQNNNKKSDQNKYKRYRTRCHKVYKYFTGTYNTLQDLKSEYRKLSRIYHPDMSTGSTEKFQEMQQEYESLKKNFAA